MFILSITTGGGILDSFRTTSHIESVWAQLKSKILMTYHNIPPNTILRFIKEAEYKININNKNNEEKINVFFEIFQFLNNMAEVDFINNDFISDNDEMSDSNSNGDNSD